jgi:hypothetical protein
MGVQIHSLWYHNTSTTATAAAAATTLPASDVQVRLLKSAYQYTVYGEGGSCAAMGTAIVTRRTL